MEVVLPLVDFTRGSERMDMMAYLMILASRPLAAKLFEVDNLEVGMAFFETLQYGPGTAAPRESKVFLAFSRLLNGPGTTLPRLRRSFWPLRDTTIWAGHHTAAGVLDQSSAVA